LNIRALLAEPLPGLDHLPLKIVASGQRRCGNVEIKRVVSVSANAAGKHYSVEAPSRVVRRILGTKQGGGRSPRGAARILHRDRDAVTLADDHAARHGLADESGIQLRHPSLPCVSGMSVCKNQRNKKGKTWELDQLHWRQFEAASAPVLS